MLGLKCSLSYSLVPKCHLFDIYAVPSSQYELSSPTSFCYMYRYHQDEAEWHADIKAAAVSLLTSWTAPTTDCPPSPNTTTFPNVLTLLLLIFFFHRWLLSIFCKYIIGHPFFVPWFIYVLSFLVMSLWFVAHSCAYLVSLWGQSHYVMCPPVAFTAPL